MNDHIQHKLKQALILPIIVFGLVSCSENKLAHLKGTITNFDAPELLIASSDSVYTLEVDTAGTVDGNIVVLEPGYFRVNYGNRFTTFFLAPGDDLTFLFDTDDLSGTLKFQGKGEAANNYMAMSVAEGHKLPTLDQIASLDEIPFLNMLDSIRTIKEGLLTLNESQFESKFLEIEKARIKYEIANMMVYYPDFHVQITMDTSFKISSTYQNILNEIDLNQSEHLILYPYQNFVHYRVSMQLNSMVNSELSRFDYFQKGLEITDEMISDNLVRNMVYTRLFDENLSAINYEEGSSLYSKYQSRFLPQDRDRFEKILGDLQLITRGQISPTFRYASIYGDTVYLENLKGKFLFIDIWATWCKPCIQEIPYMESLQEKYRSQVQFVSISVDSSPEPWQEMVRARSMQDIQLYAHNGWADPFITAYMVDAIPRFIILDPDGKIVNSSAGRPSGLADQQLADAISEFQNI